MKEILQEPLTYYMNKYSINVSQLDKIIIGSKYSAIQLKNGNIGVCSNLFNKVEVEIKDLKSPDLNNIGHRIILNAYFNATLNYSNKYNDESDIFDIVNFSTYKKIVMIGYFGPLLERFKQDDIKVSVFDLKKKNYQFTSEKNKMKYKGEAEAVILTATSIFNETFMSIVKNTRNNCDIFILGPSSIMNKDMLEYRNIKMIFGSVFQSNDERVLNTIITGGGTKQFIRFGKKVFF